jgi:phosphoribosylformylglycinamidine synthase
MLLVAKKGREEEVFKVFRKWGLDAVEVGRVISSSHMRVLEHGQVVADIPNTALTDDAPVYRRPLERWEPPVAREMPEHVKLGTRSNFTDDLKQLLASENICSKRWISSTIPWFRPTRLRALALATAA